MRVENNRSTQVDRPQPPVKTSNVFREMDWLFLHPQKYPHQQTGSFLFVHCPPLLRFGSDLCRHEACGIFRYY